MIRRWFRTDTLLGVSDVFLEVGGGGYDGYAVFWIANDLLTDTFRSGRHAEDGEKGGGGGGVRYIY